MSANNTLISIVIPIYNHGDYLKQSIDSVLNNCSYSYELILVNDGSTDNTSKILDTYKEHHSIKIIEQDNQGISNALNNGFNNTKGKFITWSSADNLYKNNALDKLSEFLTNNPDIDLVYSDVELIDENSKSFKNSNYRVQNQDKNNTSILRLPREVDTLSLYSDNFINACFLYRRWIFDLLGGYKKEFIGFEDYEYWLRVLAAGKISHLNTKDVLYSYRLHQDTLTNNLNHHELQNKQKHVVKEYQDIILNDTNLECSNNSRNIQEADNLELTNYQNKDLEVFLKSLPATYNPSLAKQMEIEIHKQIYKTEPSIDFPKILSRTNNSDYKSVEHKNNSKFSILLTNFISELEIELLANIIKKNAKSTFVAVCLDENQNKLANDLNIKLGSKNSNYRIINISGYKGVETYLEQEKYLPLVFALSNSDGLIVPCINDLFFFYNILSLCSVTKLSPILLSNNKCDFKTINYTDFSPSKFLDIKIENWHEKVSSSSLESRIFKIKNFLETKFSKQK